MIESKIERRKLKLLQYYFIIAKLGPNQSPMALSKGLWRSQYIFSQNLKLFVDGLVFGHFDELENKK